MTEQLERTGAGTVRDTVRAAVDRIAAGQPVIVADLDDPDSYGDLVFAAELATPELLAFTVQHTSGYVCVPLSSAFADRLDLPLMAPVSEDPRGTAYTVTVDAATGIATGISAQDRARTIRLLADPRSVPSDFSRPGHIVPLRARDGGVLVRPGHTEAAVDLAVLAGLQPAAVISELVSMRNPVDMARLPELVEFAREHDLVLVSVADLVAYRRAAPDPERQIELVARARMPLRQGEFEAYGYRSTVTGREIIALVHGEVGDGRDVLVRVHSECLTGDAFGSLRCDCGPQLQAALEAVVAEGRGVVLYMRGHEGRGIGLLQKLKAYELQDEGADTLDANLMLGLPADSRQYGTGAQVLAELGVVSMRLLTNNPAKRAGLLGYGLEITDRVALPASVNPENLRYLTTKRDRMGHHLDDLLGSIAERTIPGRTVTEDPTTEQELR